MAISGTQFVGNINHAYFWGRRLLYAFFEFFSERRAAEAIGNTEAIVEVSRNDAWEWGNHLKKSLNLWFVYSLSMEHICL